jgi:N-acyl-D-amino-acid deacylase
MQETFDILIRNASVVDGTGAPRYPGDIGIRGDRIDAHTHDDRLMLSSPDMAPKVSQGITTVVAGNCGISLAPMPQVPQPVTPPLNLLDEDGKWFSFPTFAAYIAELKAKPAATNCALLVGHTTLRVVTMDDLQQPATAQQIERMRGLVREALEAGAIGVSTGLFYEPAIAAPTEEVIAVCQPLKEFGGVYCTHMRDEADRVVDSLEETFRIGREVGVPVVISHLKVVGEANRGRSQEAIALIEKNMATQPICVDCYPYTAGSTVLSADRAASSSRVIVSWSKPLPQYAGQDLDAIAKQLGVSQEEAIKQLSPAGGIYFRLDESDVQRILQYGKTMIGSDGLPHDASPHPRLWGTFPRVLGHYGRLLGLFPLETAVYKMTGLTAKNFGLKDRGVLREGAYADLTLFDADTIDSAATYEKPIAPSRGIAAVIVNGAVVWQDGKSTGSRPGRVLNREMQEAGS